MQANNKFMRAGSKILYSVAAVVLLITVFLTMIGYIYYNAEKEALEDLHIQTSEIREDINLQMVSDRENLITMANFAAKLYKDSDSIHILLDSFKAIGLIENIGILTSDNQFITRVGTSDVTGVLSFEEEAAKGQYISGRVADVTTPAKEVVRSAVPIVVDGNTVAMLYGVIELDSLKARYMPMAQAYDAYLYIAERTNGNYIVDTMHDTLGNMITGKTPKTKKSISISSHGMHTHEENSGYSAYLSDDTNSYHYIHYAPLNISDWQIILAEEESKVFSEARKTGFSLIVLFSVIVLIMLLYLYVMFTDERKTSSINMLASRVRKLLLEINQQDSSIKEALMEITEYAKSRSAFFVDTDCEDYNYVIPSMQSNLLQGDDRKYIIRKMMEYAAKYRKEHNTSVSAFHLNANSNIEKTDPEFYRFLVNNNINSITIAGVSSTGSLLSLLGVVNAKRHSGVRALLGDIAVCFSMAIYNKKHLSRTETIAITDSLTRLSNRMAYKNDIIKFKNQSLAMFSCVYVDVNELHMYNNKYGHAAGDKMLCDVANALTEMFYGHYIYRMGGDEFLVFTQRIDKEAVESHISQLISKVEAMGYHISTGLAFDTDCTDIEELVKEAEKRMYEAKAEYYQQKEQKNSSRPGNKRIELFSTGLQEFDTILSIVSQHYHCVYVVSLETDTLRQMLMPDFFKSYAESEVAASKVFSRYVNEMVHPDYQRALLNFLNYDAIKKHLSEGNIPSMTYTNARDEIICLNVYSLPAISEGSTETIWVFEKIDER